AGHGCIFCFCLCRSGSHRACVNETPRYRTCFRGVSFFSGGVFLPQDSGTVPRPLEMHWVRLPLRVPPLHFIEFLGRDLRQVPDEQNQAPGLRDSVRSVEGWHAAQTNSIFNCVVELAIALVL